MDRYTVIISDFGKHDRGYRGTKTFWSLASIFGAYAELGLYWFLIRYFGRSAVTLLRPSQLLSGPKVPDTDWLFVGLPTSITKEHLRRINYRRLVLYDSTDQHEVFFLDSDQATLLSETDIVLKNFRDRRWNFPYRIGFLPIKRPPLNNRLSMAITVKKWTNGLGRDPRRRYDVGFVARPTGTVETNQRLRWMVELKRERSNLSLWGGLVGDTSWRRSFESHPDAKTLENCWLNCKKVSFSKYFSGLCESKVALAPSGYAPWSYRHFEAIYAGCMVVSNDLSNYEFLIPFPRETMVEVPDGESVVPSIDKALSMRETNPEIIEHNLRYLDRWLDKAHYSADCPDTLDRFMAELTN